MSVGITSYERLYLGLLGMVMVWSSRCYFKKAKSISTPKIN